MDPITIKLKFPISVGDETISELTVKRRPKTRDLKAMDQATGEIGKAAALLARLADVPESWIDQLDAVDFTECGAVVDGFLSSSHTGK